jgi:hypothetical protein
MAKRQDPALTVPLIIGLGLALAGIGAISPSSLHAPARSGAAGVSIADQPTGYPGDVVTYHYNAARQGQNTLESVLTPANVNFNSFGKINFFTTDGKVDAQPLYVYHLLVGGQPQNTLFAVTEHGSAYAFNDDAGTQTWQVSTIPPGETASDDRGCTQVTPEIGITSTPVIDRSRGPNGAMYLVAMSKASSGNYHQRVHALDLTTGAELFGGPVEIQATYPGTGDGSQNGQVIFAPGQYKERAGLLELDGVVYIAFSSHCDYRPYTGWVIGYDSVTLAQTSVINVTPNGNSGSIWMAGAGLAGDSQGNIYFLDANGTFDTTLDSQGFPINGDYGNGIIKLSTRPKLAVADYFNMYNTVDESDGDQDLGSGGAMLLPDLFDNNGQVHHLAVGAGKDTNIYVVDRDNMGKFNPNNNNAIYQEIPGALPLGVWSTPAYFNNTLYYGPVGGTLKAYSIGNAMLVPSPRSQTPNTFGYPGTFPVISANGTSNGIVWAVEDNPLNRSTSRGSHPGSNPALLHAYDATNLANELYNSNQARGGRDQFGIGIRFIAPIVVNGRVFIGTPKGVAEFGLLSGAGSSR